MREGGFLERMICTKTGRLVWYVLQEKQPPLKEIDPVDPINSTFEFYEEVMDAEPLTIYGS